VKEGLSDGWQDLVFSKETWNATLAILSLI